MATGFLRFGMRFLAVPEDGAFNMTCLREHYIDDGIDPL